MFSASGTSGASRVRWVFLRAYLLVAALVLVTGLGLEALLVERDQQALAQREAALLQGAFRYSEDLLPELERSDSATLAQRLAEELTLPAALFPLADFEALGEQHRQLTAGKTLQLYDTQDRAVFYRRLAQSPWVLALGPAPALHNDRAKWVVPLFYAFIALAVYLWIRPLTKDLEELQNAAQAFGRQDFGSRASLPPGSWLRPIADAFNGMAQRIQWLLQSHRELTHAVSHELRTPLARLRFSLEMFSAAPEADRERFRNSMNRDIEELNSLAEEMLGYAELEQANLAAQLQAVNLAKWMSEYVDYYNEHSPGIPLTLGELPPAGASFLADARLLSRALDNLVGNAQRFARSEISLCARLEANVCSVHVIDDGPGIPVAQREAVLTAYVRLDSEQGRERQGFGLGLAIVKRIMEVHGGEIVIESAASGGADISLNWPAA